MLAGLKDISPHLPEPSSAITRGVADPFICHKRHGNIWQLLYGSNSELSLFWVQS